MKKDGFVSMTLVYTFLIIFLFLMLAILTVYSDKNKFIDAINNKIDEDINTSKETRLSLLNKMLMDNTVSEDINIRYYDISNAIEGNGNGLFYVEDISRTDENGDGNSSRIYFYRGEVNNNHLVFADMCFRIIRTNENGTVRLRYNGNWNKNNKTCSDPWIGEEVYNSLSDNASVLGYIYSDTTSGDASPQSAIKSILDNWYYTNIASKRPDNNADKPPYSVYVSDNIFCNGRSETHVDGNITYYDAYSYIPVATEIEASLTPTLTCKEKDDRFNLSLLSGGIDDTGNNLLTYPVGLVSVADLIYAGGYLTGTTDTYLGGDHGIENQSYYMNIGQKYWTMSPYYYDSDNLEANMVCVNSVGTLVACKTDESDVKIVPVISIKSDISISSGIGLLSDPYIVK